MGGRERHQLASNQREREPAARLRCCNIKKAKEGPPNPFSRDGGNEDCRECRGRCGPGVGQERAPPLGTATEAAHPVVEDSPCALHISLLDCRSPHPLPPPDVGVSTIVPTHDFLEHSQGLAKVGGGWGVRVDGGVLGCESRWRGALARTLDELTLSLIIPSLSLSLSLPPSP